jgi:hypothetical protein
VISSLPLYNKINVDSFSTLIQMRVNLLRVQEKIKEIFYSIIIYIFTKSVYICVRLRTRVIIIDIVGPPIRKSWLHP